MTGWTQQAGPGPEATERGARLRRAAQLATAARLTTALLTVGALACAPSGTDAGKLPPNIPDPSTVQTPAGALAYYRRVLTLLPPTLDWYVTVTGVFTDELAALPAPSGISGNWTAVDSRFTAGMPSLGTFTLDFYSRFHRLRAQAREARGFLAAYALPPDSTDAYNTRDLRAQLYALEGYAEVLLADYYCSGLPLSTINFQGDYTLTPGFTTQEVYLHAAGLFDSALALISDSSARFQPLAAVGKGRALLGAGQFAEAAAAVAGVPEGYQYQVLDEGTSPDEQVDSRVVRRFASEYNQVADASGAPAHRGTPGMGDGEGGGLPYVSSNDPRTPYTELGPGWDGGTMYFPANYPLDGAVALTLASSVEARLIEAEALLQASDGDGQWLAKLNQLRQAIGLADTTDPGAALADPAARDAREDLLFRERAFWLYLSGHRQGDLRRLIRQYGRAPTLVYPSGTYDGGTGRYGEVLVTPVPIDEQRLNPQYTGCRHLQA